MIMIELNTANLDTAAAVELVLHDSTDSGLADFRRCDLRVTHN